MRSIVSALSLLLGTEDGILVEYRLEGVTLLLTFLTSTTLLADTVQLSPLTGKTTGQVTITNIERSDITYTLSNVKPHQNYGLIVYEKGDCSNYSSPIIPMVTEADGSNKPFDWVAKEFLVFIEQTGNTDRNGASVSAVGSFITNVDFKGKILVLEEVDSSKKPTGTALACGVHP